MASRSLRPRAASQYVNQREWDVDEDECIMARRYDVLQRFREYESRGDCGLVKEMKGEDFTLEYVQEHGLTSPMVFRDSAGLGMKLPQKDFSVADVKRLVGPKREVDVMDTHTQKAVTMTMHQWAKYYQTLPRKRTLNIISLEFSCTKMDSLVEPPTVVRKLDWVEGVWPREMKEAQTDPTNDMRKMMYPKVQKYCLMSVANCYTDFHLDFGGTSVWYHLIRGEKLFLLIPPSQEAYDMFHVWHLSGEQGGTFFADLIEHAQLVRLTAGDTFMMPSGWIHAVYTPSDSLVFGGNFLHSFNIPQQLAVAEMEARTKVPTKFRYPFYGSIHWYTLAKYSKELKRMGIKPEQESAETNRMETLRVKRPRWLKEVSVERMCVPEESTLPSSGRSTPSTQSLPHPHNAVNQAHIPLPILHSNKAYISMIEIEGLLLLLRKIQEEELFLSDVPPSLLDPLSLATRLTSQLKSSHIQGLLPTQPTGVTLLRSAKERKRKRKGSTLKATPEKQSKVREKDDKKTSPNTNGQSKMELNNSLHAVCPELEKAVSPNCSIEEESKEEVSTSEGSLCEVDCLESEQCSPLVVTVPVVKLNSPIPYLEDNIPCADYESDANISEPTSPGSPFILQLPSTPSSTNTPSQLLASPPPHTPHSSQVTPTQSHPTYPTPSHPSQSPLAITNSQTPHPPSDSPQPSLSCPDTTLQPVRFTPSQPPLDTPSPGSPSTEPSQNCNSSHTTLPQATLSDTLHSHT